MIVGYSGTAQILSDHRDFARPLFSTDSSRSQDKRELNQVNLNQVISFSLAQDGLLILSALADTASDWVPVIAAIVLIIRHFPQRCHWSTAIFLPPGRSSKVENLEPPSFEGWPPGDACVLVLILTYTPQKSSLEARKQSPLLRNDMLGEMFLTVTVKFCQLACRWLTLISVKLVEGVNPSGSDLWFLCVCLLFKMFVFSNEHSRGCSKPWRLWCSRSSMSKRSSSQVQLLSILHLW